jgi:uncharacterized protein YjlB
MLRFSQRVQGIVVSTPAQTSLSVGAYPPDQSWDSCQKAPTAAMAERMAHLVFPNSDPTAGRSGPLLGLWRRA